MAFGADLYLIWAATFQKKKNHFKLISFHNSFNWIPMHPYLFFFFFNCKLLKNSDLLKWLKCSHFRQRAILWYLSASGLVKRCPCCILTRTKCFSSWRLWLIALDRTYLNHHTVPQDKRHVTCLIHSGLVGFSAGHELGKELTTSTEVYHFIQFDNGLTTAYAWALPFYWPMQQMLLSP